MLRKGSDVPAHMEVREHEGAREAASANLGPLSPRPRQRLPRSNADRPKSLGTAPIKAPAPHQPTPATE